MATHQELILDQFTRQAVPFSSAQAMKDEESLKLIIEFTEATSNDTVLDVACGPGIVACAFAAVVKHATGIDLTPAMLERARLLQADKGLTNVSWQLGDILPLPYADDSFSIVTSRFAFHHMPDPQAVLCEMKRVCAPDGKVVLIDTAASEIPEQAEKFNRMEKLRDPSHTRALPLSEMRRLFEAANLPTPQVTFYKVPVEVEGLLARSFPNEGDADKVRQLVVASLEDNGMGIDTRQKNGEYRFSYPVAVVVAEKQKEFV